ncbi:SnoaL-like domain [Frankia torreyi]|uniref:SnoaL-like domain n=1 Tax=Frankia torreyi TaxID=1856 RepID=A0A0D8BES1_9ACTN|nr:MULTISPECIES: nuclear transport factor 2 family protein [Frankia]KJE21897.1 SnoaL-like domain [Frankia torreyi]KQC35846.1 polyketide cyclase [Frankia sp. ACN1ag]KQM05274.1 SnoaL-like domain [Frankia sp. CpI1-P]
MSDTTVIDDYFAGWNKQDTDAILATLTPDVVLEDVPTGHGATGTDEARAFIDNALSQTAGTTYDVVTTLSDGATYAIEWVMQPAGIRGSSFGSLREGRIAVNRDYWSLPRKSA